MNKRILVVDDNDNERESLARLLLMEDYFVFQASDGREAIELVAKERVDLVLPDLNMPGRDGRDIYRRANESQTFAAGYYYHSARQSKVHRGRRGRPRFDGKTAKLRAFAEDDGRIAFGNKATAHRSRRGAAARHSNSLAHHWHSLYLTSFELGVRARGY